MNNVYFSIKMQSAACFVLVIYPPHTLKYTYCGNIALTYNKFYLIFRGKNPSSSQLVVPYTNTETKRPCLL